ncbi:MAG: lysophospholipid acyltransferase family protein [Armatimonadota bacterium]
MRSWWRAVRPGFLALLVYSVARLIGFTLRIRVLGEAENLEPVEGGRIVAGWHGRTFLAALRWRGKGWWALVSHSRDGEMQNRIFRRFGFRTVRGSTGRGGARAAVECARLLREGETFVFTPDGPRGPSHEVQQGVLWLAKRSGAAIVPGGAAAKPCWFARSWDRYMIPMPFAKAVIVLGKPLWVPKDADDGEMQRLAGELKDALDEVERRAEEEVAR